MEVVERDVDDDRRGAPERATAPRHPAAGAVLAGEEVEERRRRGERERLHDEQPDGADAERPERREQDQDRLDVIAEQRPQVDGVERLVQVAEEPQVLREDPVVEVRRDRLVAEHRERADDERVHDGDREHDAPDAPVVRRRTSVSAERIGEQPLERGCRERRADGRRG